MNPLHLWVEPSASFKGYVWFLLFVCVVAIFRLARVWRAVLPFRRPRGENLQEYLHLLRTSSRSMKRWIGCTFLVWGIFLSTSIYDVCDRLLEEQHAGAATFLVLLADYAQTATLALCVVALLYAIRWHLEIRIEKLKNVAPAV
jgi:hypothetical protein